MLDIKALLEAECQIEEISLRRLESALQQGGYALSIGLISRMGYAVHPLLPLIPEAACRAGPATGTEDPGTGTGGTSALEAHDPDANTPFDLIFATLCQRYDDPDWDTGLLRNALSEIAEQAEISVHVVRVELDARIEGRRVTIRHRTRFRIPTRTRSTGSISLQPTPDRFSSTPRSESVDTSNPTSDRLPPDSVIAEDREIDPVSESLPENDVVTRSGTE